MMIFQIMLQKLLQPCLCFHNGSLTLGLESSSFRRLGLCLHAFHPAFSWHPLLVLFSMQFQCQYHVVIMAPKSTSGTNTVQKKSETCQMSPNWFGHAGLFHPMQRSLNKLRTIWASSKKRPSWMHPSRPAVLKRG